MRKSYFGCNNRISGRIDIKFETKSMVAMDSVGPFSKASTYSLITQNMCLRLHRCMSSILLDRLHLFVMHLGDKLAKLGCYPIFLNFCVLPGTGTMLRRDTV